MMTSWDPIPETSSCNAGWRDAECARIRCRVFVGDDADAPTSSCGLPCDLRRSLVLIPGTERAGIAGRFFHRTRPIHPIRGDDVPRASERVATKGRHAPWIVPGRVLPTNDTTAS